ncbi:MAG: hypothetical protein AUH85_06590 [Chloroflexi bacterium 13_1_40CM_4_68_4]|nr:MAG: hypothetical protein AUH85_06590 [Chloroflexi bacterium 13_1_40CM_4_68_4]
MAAVVAAIGLIGVGVFFLLGAAATTVAVPNVVGMERDQARAAILAAGLRPEVLPPDARPEKAGTVYKQEPLAGTTKSANDIVTIWISAGPGDVTIPPLNGLTLDQARKALSEAGLKLGITTERTDDLPICSQGVHRQSRAVVGSAADSDAHESSANDSDPDTDVAIAIRPHAIAHAMRPASRVNASGVWANRAWCRRHHGARRAERSTVARAAVQR